MKYTEENLGDIVDLAYCKGERIVKVFCSVCSAECIGPIREAGGFLGAHEMFHAWEFKMMLEQELVA